MCTSATYVGFVHDVRKSDCQTKNGNADFQTSIFDKVYVFQLTEMQLWVVCLCFPPVDKTANASSLGVKAITLFIKTFVSFQ